MPREVFGPHYAFLPRAEILTFEEIERLARCSSASACARSASPAASRCCATTCPSWSAMLAGIDGLDLALTTNGSLLAQHAEALAAAGLERVTVSLDSLDDEVFRRMNDVDFPVARVLDGIDAAAAAGLGPIKINAVVKRGVNDARARRAGAALPRHRPHRALHRVHGRRHAATAGGSDDVVPAERDRRAGSTPSSRSSRSSRPTAARSRGAGATATAQARSASSPRSPSRSAATARGRGCRPRASSTPACSPPPAPICGRRCAPAPPTPSSSADPRHLDARARTATPSCARRRRRRGSGSRCRTSAAERLLLFSPPGRCLGRAGPALTHQRRAPPELEAVATRSRCFDSAARGLLRANVVQTTPRPRE